MNWDWDSEALLRTGRSVRVGLARAVRAEQYCGSPCLHNEVESVKLTRRWLCDVAVAATRFV